MRILDFRFWILDLSRAAASAVFQIKNQKSKIKNAAALTPLLLAAPAPALALTPAELVMPDLRAQAVSLSSIRDGTVSYFDDTRSLRREPVHRFVQVRRIGDRVARRAPRTAMIVLTDGQQLTGAWIGAGGDGQSVRWRHPLLGDFALALDRVARIELAGPIPASDAGDDRVVLTNGDALAGFIAEVADAAVVITPTGATAAVTLPIERIAAVTLANPPRDADPTLHRLTLDDGSHLAAMELDVGGDVVRLLPALATDRATATELPIDRLARIDFTGAGYELIELTTLPMRVVERGEVFGLTFEPRVEAGRLHAHAPSKIAFDLPAGARRLAATAALDIDDTTSAQRASWAAFELVVRVDGEEAGRWPVDGDHRRTPVNVSFGQGATELTLELDPAVNGPIMDRLRLDDATLLRDRPEPRSAVEVD